MLLVRMLDSIPERDDIQVIVIDDASDEKVKQVLMKLNHKNLEVIYTQKNHGAGYERNIGLEHAKGKWLIAVDCDDQFAKGAFDVLDKYSDKDYDYICYCVVCLDNESLEPTGRSLRSDNSVRKYLKNKTQKNIKRFKFMNTESWNKMVSLKFLRENNIYWESCRINVDVFYNYQIALKAKKYIAIPDELYYFIGDSGSITRKKRSIEREFEFYLAQQKRNGFFKILGYGYPFYRYDFLYFPFILKKHGIYKTFKFYNYRHKHWNEVIEARCKYVQILKGIDFHQLLKETSSY